jgi:histidinol-phosphate aminotransferase
MTDEISEKIARWVRPEVRALHSYHVPDSRGLIKLDAMENPYPWPDALKPAWLEALRVVDLNRYPDPSARALKARLREALAVPAGAGILLGNGSDELIQIIVLALARPGAQVLAPAPTFVMYRQIAAAMGLGYVDVPLKPDFAFDLAAMQAAIETYRPAVVFLSYPNNPTGNLFDPADVEAVLQAAPGLVVIDEAYHAFAEASFMDCLTRHPNLLVMRTLSKQGMAGLRLGVLAGAPDWLDEFDKVRLPFNVGVLTQTSVEFALANTDAFDAQCHEIRAEREKLYAALRQLPGVEAWPSRANFVLFRVTSRPANQVHESLRQAGVLIKNLDSAGGMLSGCLRVSVGMPQENTAFLAALAAIL